MNMPNNIRTIIYSSGSKDFVVPLVLLKLNGNLKKSKTSFVDYRYSLSSFLQGKRPSGETDARAQ